MAATLRRTFRYPDDADDVHLTGAREELDEEEQEQMVTQLRQKNETDNRFYRTVFSVSPLIATIVYIPPLFSSGGTFIERLICIICMISLSSTAYIMKSNGSTTEETIKFPAATSKRNRWSTSFPNNIDTKQILVANSAVCALLALFSIYSENTVIYLLPGVLLAIISLARQALTEVDISELEKMRYEYKGA